VGEFLERLLQVRAEFVVAFRAAGETDDGEVLGQELVLRQVVEGGNDLAVSEVAGGAEDDRRRRRDLRRGLGDHRGTGGIIDGDGHGGP